MVDHISTKREDVERLAAALEHDQSSAEDVGFALTVAENPPPEIAAILRALLDERDDFRDRLTAAEARAVRDISAVASERDALLGGANV